MADYSSNEINDAKRRVEEMRQRAREYVDSPPQQESPPTQNNTAPLSFLSSFGIDKLGNDSSLILALILILSREGADNMLILALLYILL